MNKKNIALYKFVKRKVIYFRNSFLSAAIEFQRIFLINIQRTGTQNNKLIMVSGLGKYWTHIHFVTHSFRA